MNQLPHDSPSAVEICGAIREGRVESLEKMLGENPSLAKTQIHDTTKNECRSLLHVATDWPGNFPRCDETIASLVAAGADVNARFVGSHTETPLHWAASCNDIKAIDALVEAGADLEANGGVLDNGPPLADAVNFQQWKAAHRLVSHGAHTSLSDAAALGMIDRLAEQYENQHPSQGYIDYSFWVACNAGERKTAEFLLNKGANLNWIPDWDNLSPLDAARRGEFHDLATWLESLGADSANP